MVLNMFNEMLVTGVLEPTWHETLFAMLPKQGDRKKAGNLRPIAILKIAYKLLSRLMYRKLRPTLERRQPEDHVGFRPGRSVDDAFVVLETLCSKCVEWQTPLLLASMDLRKAFDRLEYKALFDALRAQGVATEYVALLAAMYKDQHGQVKDAPWFEIHRGVK